MGIQGQLCGASRPGKVALTTSPPHLCIREGVSVIECKWVGESSHIMVLFSDNSECCKAQSQSSQTVYPVRGQPVTLDIGWR